MKKMVYVAICDQTEAKAVAFDRCLTYDKDEALRVARADREHQSEHDRKISEHSVQGWTVDAKDEETAESAYNRMLEEACCLADAEFYEEVK